MDGRKLIELAKKATDEEWTAFKIAFEAAALQKEYDVQIAIEANEIELSEIIRTQ